MTEYRYASPLGTIRLSAENGALLAARFVSESADANEPRDQTLSDAAAWLDRYFQGEDPGPVPPYALRGTAFQQRVWAALLSIPYGETVSYADLAARAGLSRRHARAVGAAVGKNPLAIFLPCHRVIGANAALTGYAYGLERKRALLRLEQRNL